MATAVTMPFEMPHVGVGPRAAAIVADGLVTGIVIGLPLLLLFGNRTTINTTGGTTTAYSTRDPKAVALWALLTLVYFVVLEATAGATLGKLIMNLRVRQLDGSRIGWKAALIRNVARVVDMFPYVIPYLGAAIAVWADPERRQRLGDRLAGTIVTYR